MFSSIFQWLPNEFSVWAKIVPGKSLYYYNSLLQSLQTLIYEKIAWGIILYHYNKVHGFKHYKKQFSGLTLISDDG